MRMEFGLKLDLSQKLVMTPQLCQAIAILQLSSLELAEMVEKEMLENPVLELAEPRDAPAGDASDPQVSAETAEPVERADKERLDEYLDWDRYFNEGVWAGHTTAEEKNSFEAFTSRDITLEEHLEFQLDMAARDESAKQIGKYLIGCINDQGYLCATLAEVAQALGIPEERIESVLYLIQTFDPAGVGARDLRECLMLQLRQKAPGNPLVWTIVEQYLQEVADGRYKIIAEQLQVTLPQVQQAVDIIRSLDPKPGSVFGGRDQSTYITPDVTVERVNGSYIILINDSYTPRLTINPYYRDVARDVDSEAKKYVEGRINAAVWLIKSIEQRRRTLYNVMQAILDLQRPFFDCGPKFLQPLTMKKVADQVGIHESTVSRATANKYAATPHGLFSLRDFFPAGVPGVDGEALSAARVKQEIKDLITGERAEQPLSDQALADALAEKGIAVSRRTVTKYREELGIVSSGKRKRYL